MPNTEARVPNSLHILTAPLDYTVHGFSLRHDPAKRFGEEIMSLLSRVWPIIKSNAIATDGLNRVVYDEGCTVFAGVVLGPGAEAHPAASALETCRVKLTRYAMWKHVGPYHLLHATATTMNAALAAQGEHTGWPMLEVYGHWTNDESRLETEVFVALR